MFSDQTFRTIFLISVSVHGIILFCRMNLDLAVSKHKTEAFKISYVRAPVKEKPGPAPFFKLPLRITAKPVQFEPSSVEKTGTFNDIIRNIPLDSALTKPALLKPDIANVKKKIILSPPKADINKIKDPSYISYSQISREKIRRALYQNYGDSIETGIINLAFVVSKDGSLREARIIDSQSSADPFLREISLRSLEQAAPFPPFPGDLDYNPELPFNVEISFEKLD